MSEPANESMSPMTGNTDKIVAADVIVSSPGRNFVTLKITTADGVIGWGDATLNGRELSVASYLRDHVAPLLLGRDPARIEDTWQYLYRGVYWRRGPVTMAAIGAVDVALWDIKGKVTGQPVYQLLGGAVRDRILSYTHATGWDIPALLDSLDEKRALGFQALRAQTGVPGLDTVYGVTKGGEGRTNRPAGCRTQRRGLGHRRLFAVRAQGTGRGPGSRRTRDRTAARRASPAQPQPGRAARQSPGTVDLFWLEDVTPAENQEVLRYVRRTPPPRWRSARCSTRSGNSRP